MKQIIKSLLAFALLSSAAISCVKEPATTQPGEPDVAGCYGVYFPVQESSYTFDPADATKAVITVARKVTDGAIENVPFVKSDPEGVFVCSNISFEDGQSETELEIFFDEAQVGTTYNLTITIEDPAYRSTYSSMPFSIDVKVLREKWNDLGKGLYTEDFFTTFISVPNVTWEVDVQENDQKKGFYRIKNAYKANCPFLEPGDYDEEDNYLYIHAEKADQVYIDEFYTGLNIGYGEVVLWSLSGYHLRKGDTKSAATYYGSVNENKVITFPVKALLISDDDGLYYANTSGAFKLVLPGGKDVDYSLDVEAYESVDGVSDVYFTAGVDVATIKFACFEGDLNAAQLSRAIDSIKDGSEKSTVLPVEDGEAVTSVEFEKSGIYTIVAVGYDNAEKPEAQSTTSTTLKYLAVDDDTEISEVSLTVGAVATSKYFAYGSSDNVIEYYVYGNGIEYAQLLITTVEDFEKDPEAVVNKLYSSVPLSDSVIEEINGDGYVAVAKDLTPGTEYLVIISASNGYTSDVFIAEAKTTGVLKVEVEDMIGLYVGKGLSYFDGVDNETFYEIKASDDSSKGNVMFTIVQNVMAKTPVYAEVDVDANTITIPTDQLMQLVETDEEKFEIYFSVNSQSGEEPVVLQILGKGQFGNPSLWFGTYIIDLLDPKGSGWNDIYTSLSAKKIAASYEDYVSKSSAASIAPESISAKLKTRFVEAPYSRFSTREIENAVAPISSVSYTVAQASPKSSHPAKIRDFSLVKTNAQALIFQ